MANMVDIFAKNLKVTDRLDEYTNKKIEKLYRYLNDIDETRVDLSYVKSARNASDRQVAQITIRGRGYILRTEESSDDIFSAIDAAMEKMQRQIARLKGKRQQGRGDGSSYRKCQEIPEIEESEEEEEVSLKAENRSH